MARCLTSGGARYNWLVSPRKAILCSCLVISACGGTGSYSAPQLTELEVLNASANSLISSFQPINFTDPSLVPTFGTAEYAGYFLGQLANTNDDLTNSLSGRMAMQVEFAASEMISGTVFGILDDNGAPVSGQIDLSGGVLLRDGDPSVDATLTFTGDGVLTDINSNTINLEVAFEGDFLRDDFTGIAGDVLGRAEFGATNQALGGVFIVSLVDLE